MPAAARILDTTSHGTSLMPGPGSSDVLIGMLPAWRALPAGVGGGLESASSQMQSLMSSPSLTPVDATASLVQVQTGLVQSAGAAAAEGNVSAVASTASAMISLNATNAALTATYLTASAVPGGAAAAGVAYTQGIQAAAAATVGAAFQAIAGTTDMHNCPIPCPIPPHGPGVVTQASTSVFFNNLPAVRQADNVVEACGGSNAIAMGAPTVFIGDQGGSGSPSGEVGSTSAASAAAGVIATVEDVMAAATVIHQNEMAATSGAALCEVCDDSGAGT